MLEFECSVGLFGGARPEENGSNRLGLIVAAATIAVMSLTHQTLLAHCLAYPGAWKDQPWGEEVVTKVDEKIFAFVHDGAVGVKCGESREEADHWLLRYPDDVEVMAYIGRHGWNVIRFGSAVPDSEVFEAVEDSYLAVVSKLPKKRRPEGWDRFEPG